MNVKIYDTTLRDGMQGEKISFSVEEKIKVALKLDELGVHYIEGGFPLANEKEKAFFEKMKNATLNNSKLAAFGSTRKPLSKVETDAHMLALIQADTPVVTVVGKTWKAHVSEVLKTTAEENLNMIYDSIAFLKSKGREVIYDAEHFFDGFLDDEKYALLTIETAMKAGADTAVLCDTNGGMIHTSLIKALKSVIKIDNIKFGIHLHNDTGFAVSNSILSLDYGCSQIQGTINGWGERCGNANLCTIIGNIYFKIGYPVISKNQINKLTNISKYISDLANIIPFHRDPFVGSSAFAHKAGQHADVVNKNSTLMEHMDSKEVGNHRRILVSELAGKSTIIYKLKKYGNFDKNSPEVLEIATLLKEKEAQGFEYEMAEASFELMILKVIKKYKQVFELLHYEVDSFQSGVGAIKTLSKVRIISHKREAFGAATSAGPFDALMKSLRHALIDNYQNYFDVVRLSDYKVRVIDGEKATSAKVRVFIQSTNSKESWYTVGVSENIIEASWQAMIDSFDYYYNVVSE